MSTEELSTITIISDSRFLDHDTGGGIHPEVPARLQVIVEHLKRSDLISSCTFHPPTPTERRWILSVHDEDWLFRFEESALSGKTYIDHVDNQICFESYEVACLAVGAATTAIDLMEDDKAKQTFCLIRPPGHHAEKNKPYGFCFFNNCVIAARYWQQKYNKRRVLVFDFDAHHGNGIQSAFERESDSVYISIHEHPSFSYPGTGYAEETGIGAGKGTILNLPISPGDGDERVKVILREKIEPYLEQHRPEAIIVAAGFDGHYLDDMSGLTYTTELFGLFGNVVRKWSETYTKGRLLSILEGGYELSVQGESVQAYLNGLLGGR